MAKETEGIELNADVTGRGVRNLLSSPEKVRLSTLAMRRLRFSFLQGFYVVALVDGVFAGSLMITTEWSDWRDGASISFDERLTPTDTPSFVRLLLVDSVCLYSSRVSQPRHLPTAVQLC